MYKAFSSFRHPLQPLIMKKYGGGFVRTIVDQPNEPDWRNLVSFVEAGDCRRPQTSCSWLVVITVGTPDTVSASRSHNFHCVSSRPAGAGVGKAGLNRPGPKSLCPGLYWLLEKWGVGLQNGLTAFWIESESVQSARCFMVRTFPEIKEHGYEKSGIPVYEALQPPLLQSQRSFEG